ncbi:MAG: hypothetical protein HGJ97_17915 [Desulfosporosinus sp.]|nr:hypothetical protein [Desulfosporosinus sp.]
MENNLVSNGLDVTCNRTKFSDLTSKEIFGGDSGCPQSGSTGDNPRLKSHNSEQNTLKMLREMKEAMGVPALELQTINKGEDFEEEFSSYFKTIYSDKSYLIHSQFVVKVIKKIASEKYGENNYYQLLLDSEFLTEVLKELEKTNSYKKRKTILRKICKFYYDKLNLSRLNIERNKCVNLLNWYGKKSIHHVGVELEIHPKVQEFIDYLTQVGQTWQKRARLNASSFLTWLVETKEVDQDNPIHINVRQIKSETLYKYRNYLLMRVELKQKAKAKTYASEDLI